MKNNINKIKNKSIVMVDRYYENSMKLVGLLLGSLAPIKYKEVVMSPFCNRSAEDTEQTFIKKAVGLFCISMLVIAIVVLIAYGISKLNSSKGTIDTQLNGLENSVKALK